ncbi:MAG: prolipoprotein diacylglyceryl transferase [Pirellulaceae bacterium]|nr:prolipoprotein diacylglyceryl transferase [Pirellulaceae bacterium]
MRSTLFFIPHEIGPFTFLGFGWALLLLVILFVLNVGYRRFRGESWSRAAGDWVTWAIGAAVIAFLLPRIEQEFPNGMGGVYKVGLPIRGYGLMLMSGVIAAIGLSYYRAKQFGWSVDQLLSLAFATVVSGIIGARVFFVVQKWSELPGDTLWERLYEALKFTEGGLVVYGCLIGGVMGITLWCFWKGFRLLAITDLIMPGFLLGLAIGRVGCLFNGCCFGGYCDANLPAISFPRGSLPYMEQLESGELLGLRLASRDSFGQGTIAEVRPETWASQQGLKPGMQIELRTGATPPQRGQDPAGPLQVMAEIAVDGRVLEVTAVLPKRSLATHPTQIYSTIDAALLSGFLFCLWPNVRREGTVFGLGLIMYGFSRIIEEWIRVDEAGQFGTSLTISQWISLGGILTGLTILILQRSWPMDARIGLKQVSNREPSALAAGS